VLNSVKATNALCVFCPSVQVPIWPVKFSHQQSQRFFIWIHMGTWFNLD